MAEKKKKSQRPMLRTSHTKGYYRFSKEFPSVKDSNGFRDNETVINTPSKKASFRKKIIAASVVMFVIAFFVTSLAFSVSKLPIKNGNNTIGITNAPTGVSGISALCLPGETLSLDSLDTLIGELKINRVNTVIIDFKDANGYFYYKPSLNQSAEAISTAGENSAKIVSELKAAGFSVFAKISLFADDIYARNHRDLAAFVTTTPVSGSTETKTSLYYSKTNGHAYLTPHSNEVTYYLSKIVSDISAMGANAIIFDNAIIPTEAYEMGAKFPLSEGKTTATAASELISYLINSCPIPVGISLNSSELLSYVRDNKTPAEITENADYIFLDARASVAEKNTVIGNKTFVTPTAAAAEYAQDLISSSLKLFEEAEYNCEIIALVDEENLSGCIKAINSLNSDKANNIAYNNEINQ